MSDIEQRCLYCEHNSEEVPLLTLQFKSKEIWLCPQHLPILIHDPAQLIGKLAGAENLRPAEHHD